MHRDLKPHNIMLVRRSGGEAGGPAGPRDDQRVEDADSTIVKLFDFGLSRMPRGGLGESAEETGDGIIVGTPGYMAPEQTRGEVVTPAADIFSFGCVLFEAFYGKRAFEGRTKASLFSATLHDDPQPDPIRRRDDVELADLIQSCLQKDAAERPESAARIARQLRRRGSPRKLVPQSVGRAQVTRRRLMELVGGGIAGAAFAGDLRKQRRRQTDADRLDCRPVFYGRFAGYKFLGEAIIRWSGIAAATHWRYATSTGRTACRVVGS